jgi:hypothetical protein
VLGRELAAQEEVQLAIAVDVGERGGRQEAGEGLHQDRVGEVEGGALGSALVEEQEGQRVLRPGWRGNAYGGPAGLFCYWLVRGEIDTAQSARWPTFLKEARLTI